MVLPPLRGERVELRPLRRSDGHALDLILSDRRVTKLLPPRVRREGGSHYVNRVLAEHLRGEGVPFVVVPLGSDEVIGQIRFVTWSRTERRAEVGYFIRRRFWGRGYATDALRLICRFGFRSMALRRIEATVVVGNVASRRVLEHVGFRWEGQAREAARVARGWEDAWAFGMLRPDFRAAER